MRKLVFLGLCSIAAAPFQAYGQDAPAAAKASPYVSTVGAITDIADTKLTIKTDAGASVVVPLNEKTRFSKIAAGEKDPRKATESSLSELKPGDRVLARSRKSDAGDLAPAATVLVMSKEEVAKAQEKTQQEWQQNGLHGVVTVVNPATKEITMKVLGPDPKMVTIEPAGKVDVRRYSQDSVLYADAQPSSLSEIRTGDQVRVLGKKSDDGSRVTPEAVVFGTFAIKAGTITAIDPATGIVTIKDLTTKKPLSVKVNSATVLKKLPEQMAQGLARMQQAKANGGNTTPVSGSGRGTGEGRGPGGPGGGMRLDPARAVERSPSITLADLKSGDALMIMSSVGADPAKVTAITLVAGVEPLLTAPATRNSQDPSAGSWGIEMPGVGQ